MISMKMIQTARTKEWGMKGWARKMTQSKMMETKAKQCTKLRKRTVLKKIMDP